MEPSRRSPRLAAKLLQQQQIPVLPLLGLNVFKKPKPKQDQAVFYQKHDQTSLFINFIVHGIMKYEMNDPKAREIKEKTLHFIQLTFAFVLIKIIFWYFKVL